MGETVEAAAWWYVSMDDAARVQLLTEAAGKPILIDPETAALTASQVARPRGGRLSFQPLWELITAQEPDLLD